MIYNIVEALHPLILSNVRKCDNCSPLGEDCLCQIETTTVRRKVELVASSSSLVMNNSGNIL